VKCGCTRKSVKIEVIENDFARLIKLLTIREDKLPLMVNLTTRTEGSGIDDQDFEAQKAAAIAKARRQVENARFLFLEGDISQDEYLRRKEHNERQIAHWEARTTEGERAAIELAMCMEALDNLARLWDTANDEDRQQVARMLFESVTYDLDRQQIVDFRLKPWADRYLVLRASLYGDDDPLGVPADDGGNDDDSGGSEGGVSGKDSDKKSNGPSLKTRTDYCPIGATNLQLASISGLPPSTLSKCCTTPHFPRNPRTICPTKPNATPRFAPVTSRVKRLAS